MGRKRKHDKRRKPPIAAGDRFGALQVIKPDSGRRKQGHVLVRVRSLTCTYQCRNCQGKPFEVRSDNLRSGRIVSCGKVKRVLRWQYMREKNAQAEAMKLPGVDSITGKAIHEK
jgi:hypothetical protein